MAKSLGLRRKRLPQSVNVLSRRRGPGILVIIMSAVVAAVIAIGLWISVSAIAAKVHLSQGARQIITLVSSSREAARIDHQLGVDGKQDLVAILERMGRATSTGEAGGYKSLTNPWGGNLYVQAASPTQIRLETTLPPFACVRIIDLFADSAKQVGLQQIDIQGWNNTWLGIYTNGKDMSEASIGAACSHGPQSYLALTFALR